MIEWLVVLVVVIVGATAGYLLGRGSISGAPVRVHKTIDLDPSSSSSSPRSPSSRRPRGVSTDGGSEDDEIAAEDADEDLATTLAHMKQEHAQHVKQFEDANVAASLSPDPASPPIPLDAHRRLFIVAKSLPLQVTNITGLPTPSQTPLTSPFTGPSSAQSIEDGFALAENGVAATRNSDDAPAANSFDQQKRPSLSQIAGLSLPGSSVVTQDGTKFRVEWDDSRSFLSNLRCLLTPNAPATTTTALPTGLTAVPDQAEVTWIGLSSVTSTADFASADERTAYEATLSANHCVPVYLDAEVQEGYQSFCKSILWPLLHYMMPTNTNDNVALKWAEYWDSYQKANQCYADAICEQMKHPRSSRQEEPIVWIHNMHLFGLPQMIRQQLPRATIGLFIHTPFPSSDVFRALPTRKELLESIMESDLLGFHTFDYARHFLSCIKRVMDLDFETLPGGVLGVRYNGRFVSIIISHVGIQSGVFKEAADSDVLKRRVEKLRAQHAGKKIVVGIDDVDVAKAPLLKLQAFDRFLSRHPEWKDKIVILEMFQPSKNMDSALGVKIQRDLDAYVEDLRRKYGRGIIEIIAPFCERTADQGGGVAISGGLKLMELVRLYNAADVALISTFFDGLNLIPFEFTASQGNSVPGALIISEFMGCSRSLNGVLRVNPWNLESISDALQSALSMSTDERRANHSRRYNYVMHHTVDRWAAGFLDQLAKATKLGAELNYVHVGHGATHKLLGLKSSFVHLPTETLTSTYSAAETRVIFLDYDGTLVPTDKDAPDAATTARPPSGVVKLLKFLSEAPNTIVFLMSGRTRSVLTDWFGDIVNLGLAAEKGLFLRWPQRIADECRFDRGQEEEEESSSDEDDEDAEEDANGACADQAADQTAAADDASRPLSHVRDADWECIVPLEDATWKSTAIEIIRAYTEQTDGSWIEDKEFAIVWHYEQADVAYGRAQSMELQKYLVKILANPKVDVLRYDKSRILEVKPHGVNKGLAATAILESLWIMNEKEHRPAGDASGSPANRSRYGLALSPTANSGVVALPAEGLSPRTLATPFRPFVLAIGDDRSDEEMFVQVQRKSYLDGRVRGRESRPYVDAFARSVSLSSVSVPTSIPVTPSNTFHDPETSPTPMSPSIGLSRRPQAPPSDDPYLFTVCVGLKPSSAHYYVNTTEEVLRSLYGLVLRDQDDKAAAAVREESKDTVRVERFGLSKRATAPANFAAGLGLGTKKGSFGTLANLLFAGKKE